jgi:tetratricopeptide (TPR) repeat protein
LFRRESLHRDVALQLEKAREDRSAWVEDRFNDTATLAGYPRAFERLGLSLQPGDEAAQAERIRQSSLHELLVAALDDWAMTIRGLRRRDPSKKVLQARLLHVARLADPDPWQDQLRDAALWDQRRPLEKLARQALDDRKVLARLSPHMLALLGALLHSGPEAEEVLRQAQFAHPTDFWLNFHLGMALDSSKPAQAEGFFRAALTLRPEHTAALNNLGNTLFRQKRVKEAAAHYARAVAIDPHTARFYGNLGNALRHLKDYKGATAQLHKALEIDPNFAGIYFLLGNTLRDSKEPEGAMKQYRKALELDPEYAQAHNNLGLTLAEQRQPALAVEHFRKALEYDPRLAQAHNNLANTLVRQGDDQGALSHYKKALELNPRSFATHSSLADFFDNRKDPKQAAAHYRIDIEPDNPKPHYGLGRVLHLGGDPLGALPHYRKAIQLNPNYAEAYCNLADILRVQGKLAESFQTLRRGHELGARRPDWPYPSEKWLKISAGLLLKETLQQLQADLKQCRAKVDIPAGPKAPRPAPADVFWVDDALTRRLTGPNLAALSDARTLALLTAEEQKNLGQLRAEVDELSKQVRAFFLTKAAQTGSLTAQQKERTHEVKLTAGTTYAFDLSSEAFDTFLRLEDGKGTKLAENDDIDPDTNLNSRILFTAPADGTYRLIATSFEQRGTGSYTVLIREFRGAR